ncbi:MAG: hypothetical protein R2766_04465 [Saprospiraceae bacterium]
MIFARIFRFNINWNPLKTDKLGDRNLSMSSTQDLDQSRVELVGL